MADLGLYNFIKSQLANGTPKESIVGMLEKNGTSQEAIGAAFAAVETGAPPDLPATGTISQSRSTAITVASRPMAVTIVCVILGVEWLLSALAVFGIMSVIGLALVSNPSGGGLGAFLVLTPALLILIPGLAVIYGYWKMRRWGVQLYTLIFVFSILISLLHPLQLLSIHTLFGIIVLGVGYKYLSEMN